MKGFADMSLAEVRQLGDDAYADLVRQRHGTLASLTIDDIETIVAGLGGTRVDAERVFDAVVAQISPYLIERIRPVDILAA